MSSHGKIRIIATLATSVVLIASGCGTKEDGNGPAGASTLATSLTDLGLRMAASESDAGSVYVLVTTPSGGPGDIRVSR
jgi:hypothetical protein